MAVFCLVCALLSGCGGKTLEEGARSQISQPYKHFLTLSGDFSSEISDLVEKSDLSDTLVLVPKPVTGSLTLRLTLQTLTQGDVVAQRPALAGQLVRQTVAPRYIVRYTLLGPDNRMLEAGDVRHKGKARRVFMPQLDESIFAPHKKDIEKLMEQLSARILPAIQKQPWQGRVQKTLQGTHVEIIGGQNIGLHYGDMLQTVGGPVAMMQVVSFEKDRQGGDRTVLRLIEGRLPEVGRLLVPTIQ